MSTETATAAPDVLTEVDDGILIVTLNRPDRRNALTTAAARQFIAAIDEADARDDVRAVVIRGVGKSFCVGADLSRGAETFAKSDEEPGAEAPERDFGGVVALRLFASHKPLVAAVHGDAVGMGASMLLPMDIRFAARGTRFAFPFSRRGIVTESCASWFLPRIVGISTALRWTMSGALFDVEEAHAAGMIQHISEPEELVGDAIAAARALVEQSAPVSVAAIRLMVWQGLTMSHPMEAHRMESELVRARGASPDAHEGVTAFLERRVADFPGLPSRDLEPFLEWFTEPPFDPAATD